MTMKRISMGLNASQRGFLKNSLAGAGTAGAAKLFADDHSSRLNKGDAALLRFAAAAKSWKLTFEHSTTNSEGFKMLKCQQEAENQPTPANC
jgi:hypothetical protein